MAVDVHTSVAAAPRPHGDAGQAACRVFFAIGAVLFAAAAWVTIARCNGMSMAGMPMPGGWTMSMTWMRMPGQNWLAATATFLGMWSPMMVAMMLPSLLPTLWRFHQAVGRTGSVRQASLTALVAIAYFLVWTALGLVIFPAGATLAAILMRWPALSRAVPLATAIVVLAAAALQFSPWKVRRLACCRRAPNTFPANAVTAWRYGLYLGVHCLYCCAGLVAAQLAIGVMDLGTMAVLATVVTAERLGENSTSSSSGLRHPADMRTGRGPGQ